MRYCINLLIILLLLNACSWEEDGELIDVKRPARIINKTDLSFILEAKWTDNHGNDSINSYTIKAGDILYIYDYMTSTEDASNVYKSQVNFSVSECGLYALGCENDPMDIRLIFQSEEKQCLLYKGAIKENDIRTINSFEEYHVERSVGVNVHLYEYIITEDMLKEAVPCD
jgi:hypothetical protein